MHNYDYQKIQGFSLLEVLIAITLLTIMMLSLGELMLAALHRTQQALYQTIAVEQLDGLASLMTQFPDQYLSFFSQWNEENKNLLSDGQGDINSSSNASTLSLSWRSGFSHLWRCQSTLIKDYSCFQLEIYQ